ncbi:MAG: heavy-metal-associated domain-containing protein, partial [Elusimicrobiales bacterium]|nr:heavy-metal-associated domain-containing protein [Elusimicrobiales bacterium]
MADKHKKIKETTAIALPMSPAREVMPNDNDISEKPVIKQAEKINGKTKHALKAEIAKKPNIKQVVMPLEGIHGAECVSKIESILFGMNEIDKASVHLPTKMAFINYDEELISSSEISDKIEKAGYKVLTVSSFSQNKAEDIALISIEKEK